MTTRDLKWLAEQIEIKLERIRAKTEREQEMIQRSAELIAKAKALLSEPAPKRPPQLAASTSSARRYCDRRGQIVPPFVHQIP
ncbi:hypothetical protein [Bradyrhizobium sp. CCBAU 11357]|uniref:hypothetical protein n=1 Tax=Bradyrhizobium sp. CCBAU 11357 TaxID=1630808 RepID=UPI00230330BF|nr:hypothetical protein [Bradyrhizobium sp. CCBAU 11357]MDA9497351.1 hypothetical protein [Bradyrhizobium sp. CCBAU 11357]